MMMTPKQGQFETQAMFLCQRFFHVFLTSMYYYCVLYKALLSMDVIVYTNILNESDQESEKKRG